MMETGTGPVGTHGGVTGHPIGGASLVQEVCASKLHVQCAGGGLSRSSVQMGTTKIYGRRS